MNGKNWKDYAVLYRGNFQARVLETQLRQMQIPYKLSGGTSFFARAEIKDVMSYLRLIINPEDDSAFLRIINTPKRAIGPVTLEKLGLFAQENNLSLLGASSDQRLSMVLPKRQKLNCMSLLILSRRLHVSCWKMMSLCLKFVK